LNVPKILEESQMNTLTSEPVASLLAKLFADAEQTTAALRQVRASLSPADRTTLGTDSSDYRGFYSRLRHAHLAVSPETGKLVYLLARSARARSIVEFGTSFAISTIHLAAALRDNGGGKLIGSEFESSKIVQARLNIEAAALSDLVDIREGDALETLSRDLPATIDFVLLDGAKSLYGSVLSLLEARLHAGSLIVADNADWSPEYLARVRSAEGGYLSVPFGTDVELSMRL
jgi:predicted O-methyltransferase YrrM